MTARSGPARAGSGAGKVLVTDLDGTLLGGTRFDRRRLKEALDRHPEVTVVFATGRGLPSVREVLDDPLVPRPRWVIADVGATVARGPRLTPDAGLVALLRAGWPGTRRVREALARFPALEYQDGVAQDGRCSFHAGPGGVDAAVTAAVRALGCAWQYSGGRFFDVLPAGASKGAALLALAARERWPLSSVLVAGDSLNDVSLYGLGAHGVIVGGAEPELAVATAADRLVYRARPPGAAGIAAALVRLGWIGPDPIAPVGTATGDGVDTGYRGDGGLGRGGVPGGEESALRR